MCLTVHLPGDHRRFVPVKSIEKLPDILSHCTYFQWTVISIIRYRNYAQTARRRQSHPALFLVTRHGDREQEGSSSPPELLKLHLIFLAPSQVAAIALKAEPP